MLAINWSTKIHFTWMIYWNKRRHVCIDFVITLHHTDVFVIAYVAYDCSEEAENPAINGTQMITVRRNVWSLRAKPASPLRFYVAGISSYCVTFVKPWRNTQCFRPQQENWKQGSPMLYQRPSTLAEVTATKPISSRSPRIVILTWKLFFIEIWRKWHNFLGESP